MIFFFQQKGLDKGMSEVSNVTGNLIGGLIGGKPDVKGVMNVVSVNFTFYNFTKNTFPQNV